MPIILAQVEAPPAATSPASLITAPIWMSVPPLQNFYPLAAQRRNVGGRVVIQCAVTAQGTLDGCAVLEEMPLNEGFGAAAIRASSGFRMKLQDKSGASVIGGTVRLPLRFGIMSAPPKGAKPIELTP